MGEFSLDYIINHLGESHDQYFGAVAPPLIQSSNFCFHEVAALREAFLREQDIPVYTRGNNPTVAILRKKLAALAGAEDALLFSSGAMAVAAAVMSNLKQGDHVICVDKPYTWTRRLFSEYLVRFGVRCTYVDGRVPENFHQFLQPETRVVYLESPNSMTLELQDIRRISAWAKSHGLVTILDNSYSTSLGQKALEMGIDLEVHSGTKYYGGHSDLVAGLVLGKQEQIDKIFRGEFMTLGGILSPHDAWLMLRSLRTLPLRLERSGKSAMALSQWLAQHPLVEKIHYPGSPEFPQYQLAQEQMRWSGGLMAIWFKCNDALRMEKFCNALQAFRMAVSWGGHESLIIPAVSFYPRDTDPALRHLPLNLVRFYIGLEDPEYLKADLEQALHYLE